MEDHEEKFTKKDLMQLLAQNQELMTEWRRIRQLQKETTAVRGAVVAEMAVERDQADREEQVNRVDTGRVGRSVGYNDGRGNNRGSFRRGDDRGGYARDDVRGHRGGSYGGSYRGSYGDRGGYDGYQSGGYQSGGYQNGGYQSGNGYQRGGYRGRGGFVSGSGIGNNRGGYNGQRVEVVCGTCGGRGHRETECLVRCYGCQGTGHVRRNCPGNVSARAVVANTEQGIVSEVQAARQYLKVPVNGVAIEFQLDTAADITLIGVNEWKQLGSPKLEPSDKTVRCASGKLMEIRGRVLVKFELKGAESNGYCYVRDSGALLGLEWLNQSTEMKRLMEEMVNVVEVANSAELGEKLKLEYPEVFAEGLGRCVMEKISFRVKEGAVPVYKRARPVPYGAMEAVEKELDRLVEMGVLEKISFSQWAAPIVVVKKTDGRIRICADFRTGLNKALEDEAHPLPTMEDVFATLKGSIFSTIDLSDAYLQLEVEEESQKLVTISTHRGLYCYKRMPFGVKVAPGLFQKIMDKMIAGLQGTIAYLDDIIVKGDSKEEHERNLKALFERLKEYGFRVNLKKCSFAQPQLRYLGFIIDARGRRPDQKKTEVIRGMKAPSDAKELRSFLGMVSFYGRFIDQMTTLRAPLDLLLRQDAEWKWTDVEDGKFEELKKVICSDVNLAHFDPEREIIVAADASSYGLGAVLTHRLDTGQEVPVMHVARRLTETERRYSQIEKEGLGIVFALQKFHRYVYGRKFLLRTDHRPLLSLFGQNKDLPVHSQNRIVRWATMLAGYDYELEHVGTEKFGQADALSRMAQREPLGDQEDCVIAEVLEEDYLAEDIRRLPVREEDVRRESANDPMLAKIIKYVEKRRWPEEKEITPEEKVYYRRREQLTVISGCLLMETRVVIPRKLQWIVLRQLHEGHLGIVRMKQVARSFVFWTGLDSDCEEMVKRCEKCQENQKTPPKTTLKPWPTPKRVWERVHIDFAGPEHGKYYLVIVDAKTKWPEVLVMNTISAEATVRVMRGVFARQGYPEQLVSDNGTQFCSSLFKQLCDEGGIQHIRTAPYHPMSNGQAERFVDILKRGLRKLRGEGRSNEELVDELLMKYRSTPNGALNGQTPAEAHLGRCMRTRMSLLRPQPKASSGEDDYKRKMKDQFDRKHGTRERSFEVGDRVYVQKHEANKWTWRPGTVEGTIGAVMYMVRVSGQVCRFHVNQMRSRWSTCAEERWMETMADVLLSSPRRRMPEDEVPTEEEEGQRKTEDGVIKTGGEGEQSQKPQNQVVRKSQIPVPQYPARRQPPQPMRQRPTSSQIPVPLRRGSRIRRPPVRYDPCVNYVNQEPLRRGRCYIGKNVENQTYDLRNDPYQAYDPRSPYRDQGHR